MGDAFALPAGTACGSLVEVSLRNAIDAHLRWKDSLENHVHGVGSAPLSLEDVVADDQCLLGQWIHGPGKELLGESETFQALVAAHACFHSHAGAIVAALQRGDLAAATERLQVGDYPRASAEVKILLARLYVEALCATHRPGQDGDH
jgi:hypothetical protein